MTIHTQGVSTEAPCVLLLPRVLTRYRSTHMSNPMTVAVEPVLGDNNLTFDLRDVVAMEYSDTDHRTVIMLRGGHRLNVHGGQSKALYALYTERAKHCFEAERTS